MRDFEAKISSFLKDNSQSRFFLACSGGVDSMVLLHVMHKLGKRISAVHVNYLLRGDDSESDQELVESVCKEKNIPCHVKRVDLNKYLVKMGGNLQDEARKIRYSYFETFKLKENFKVVLGQHADDQVETFFLNLARGSGIMGLACMLPEHNNYLRPLLSFSKEEIRDYAKANGVKWREDVSNESNKYARNKLRNVILPELKAAIPTLQESVLLLTRVFQENQKALEIKMRPLVQLIGRSNEMSFEQFDQLDTFDLMELLRQMEIPMNMHTEFVKLRNSVKGKRIEFVHEHLSEVIHEGKSFYFKRRIFEDFVPELKIEIVDSLPTVFSKDIVFLDSAEINGELIVRKWKAGDRMRPIGLEGSKLISDILSDAKVPNHLRENQLVAEDDEKIVWCVGYAVGQEAVAKEGCEIWKISLSRVSPLEGGLRGVEIV